MKTLILISMLVNSFLWSQDVADLELTDVNGDIQTLGQMTEKEFVLVDFWAPWCAPCRRVIPTLVKSYNELKDKDLVVIGYTRLYGRYSDDLPENRKAKVEPEEDKVGGNDNIIESGIASWYGGKFNGRRTANGEVYEVDPESYDAIPETRDRRRPAWPGLSSTARPRPRPKPASPATTRGSPTPPPPTRIA